MTRKRYIKLLMANGISRNTANFSAMIARNNGKSYEAAYKKFQDDSIYQIEKFIRRVADMAYHIGCALVKASTAFIETYRAEIAKLE